MESYQRAQALILLEDMANRIATNRANGCGLHHGPSPLGAGMTCPTARSTVQNADAREWCEALQGAAETTGVSNVGAMVGAAAASKAAVANEYLVTVAWQGLGSDFCPPDSVPAGRMRMTAGLASMILPSHRHHYCTHWDI